MPRTCTRAPSLTPRSSPAAVPCFAGSRPRLRRRLGRVQAPLRGSRGKLDVPEMARRIRRDRDGVPDALYRAEGEEGEWEDDVTSIASTIAAVTARRLWITVGPPHVAAYCPYEV